MFIKKIIAFLLTGMCLLCCSSPAIVYADGGTSSSGNGSHVSGTHKHSGTVVLNSLEWKYFDREYTDVISDIEHYTNVNFGDNDIRQAMKGRYLTDTPGLENAGHPTLYGSDFFPFRTLEPYGLGQYYGYFEGEQLPEEFAQEAEKYGYVWRDGSCSGADGKPLYGSWYWNGSQGLDSIWISEYDKYVTTTKMFLSYHADKHKTYVDDRAHDAEWFWYHGKSQSEYDYRTKPLEKSDTNVEKGEVCSVNEIIHYRCHLDDSGNEVCREVGRSYQFAGSASFQRTFTYDTKIPVINQECYRPFNLNRNGYATAEDIATFGNEDNMGLEGSVNNKQGIVDNSPLQALDINSETPFTAKFNNYSFGLRSGYNWDNLPQPLENGNYENVRSEGSGSYSNGKDDVADSDGHLRYYLNFYGSISNNKENPAIDSASLKNQKVEYPASKEIHKTIADKWTGGDFVARFTYVDGYNTDNETVRYFPNWWATTYHEGRFYEYGTHYKGLVTTSGIQNPSYCLNSITGLDPAVNIRCDADKNDRGLYIDLKECFFSQPILYGKWDVKTVAGSVN